MLHSIHLLEQYGSIVPVAGEDWTILFNPIGASLFAVLYTVHSNEISSQLKAARAQSETAKQELNDYKEKAARILQV
jgi:hypothetical protein